MSYDASGGHDLDWLLSPIGFHAFCSEYWDRSALWVGGRGGAYYEGFYSLGHLDAALNDLTIRPPFLRVVKDGKELPLSTLSGAGGDRANLLEDVLSHHRRGASIVSQFLHEQGRHLKAFSAELSRALSAKVQINAYLTPHDERGLGKHFDTHDVFVLQVHGKKAWTLYDRVERVPFQGERGNQDEIDAQEPTQELVIAAGDLLYVPRGLVHKAESLEASSLHLTVGVHPLRWAQVIQAAVTEVVASDPRFRTALPAGFATDKEKADSARGRFHELWSVVGRAVTADALVQRAVASARHVAAPNLDGHLADLERLGEIGISTRLWVRPGIHRSPQAEPETVCLEFAGKRVSMPAALSDCVEMLMSRRTLRVGDLPDMLTDDDKRLFARRLVGEGLLTLNGA